MAEKPAVAVRLTKPTIARAAAYAESRGVSRQVVYETAVVRFLDDVETAPAPELLVAARSPSRREVAEADEAVRAARAEWATNMAARMTKLNADKERASR